jgi:hypothetical protein
MEPNTRPETALLCAVVAAQPTSRSAMAAISKLNSQMSEESELVAVRAERYDLFLDMSFRDQIQR